MPSSGAVERSHNDSRKSSDMNHGGFVVNGDVVVGGGEAIDPNNSSVTGRNTREETPVTCSLHKFLNKIFQRL